MFGVNLKLRYPFIGAIVGSGIGSAYIAGYCLDRITAGLSQSIQYMGWLHYVGMTISFIVAITVTLIYRKEKQIKSCRIKIGMTVIKVSSLQMQGMKLKLSYLLI